MMTVYVSKLRLSIRSLLAHSPLHYTWTIRLSLPVSFSLFILTMATQQVLNIKWLNALNSKKVILASSSPRRKDILAHLGVKYTVVPSTFPETLDKSLFSHPSEYVKENALQKALEVYERMKVSNAYFRLSMKCCISTCLWHQAWF